MSQRLREILALPQCPRCGGRAGYWNVLLTRPKNAFECASCGIRLSADMQRGLTLIAIVAFAAFFCLMAVGVPWFLEGLHAVVALFVAVGILPFFARVKVV